MDLAFGGDVRHDLLLPIHNSKDFGELASVLGSAVSKLQPLLTAGGNSLLPHLHGGSSIETHDNMHSLEVVEVASLIVRCGSNHQQLHGDYRRFPLDEADVRASQAEPEDHTRARTGKMPPRMVTFVALQDVPSIQHGATGDADGASPGSHVVGAGEGKAAAGELIQMRRFDLRLAITTEMSRSVFANNPDNIGLIRRC